MRLLLLLGALTACSTDTFVGSDGGGNDAPNGGDAIGSTDGQSTFDPSQLGSNIVLWVDAADAKFTGDLVTDWPDHQNRYQTQIDVGTSAICPTPGLHTAKNASGKPVVRFCGADLRVGDTASLRVGTAPFYITAVIAPPANAATGDVLYTKSPGGTTTAEPTGLTVLAPDGSSHLQGWINGNASATSPNALAQQFTVVTFVRYPAQINVRVNGTSPQATNIQSNDGSSNSDDVTIGGYSFSDVDIRHVFRGDLAELIVVLDPASMPQMEAWLKQKYGL